MIGHPFPSSIRELHVGDVVTAENKMSWTILGIDYENDIITEIKFPSGSFQHTFKSWISSCNGCVYIPKIRKFKKYADRLKAV
jgi:hypothetical protein